MMSKFGEQTGDDLANAKAYTDRTLHPHKGNFDSFGPTKMPRL
ncbi:hypothetical protein [Acetivibrio mesophilus]|nr:hypothetical protein [Acetivibrio mesophilus]